jgi:PAS domain S-box-containing protein
MRAVAAEQLEQVLDHAHSAVTSLDAAGLVTYWNPSAARMFQVSATTALGRPVADLIIPERFREAHHAGIRRFLTEGVGPMLDRRVELAALRADGSEFPVEMTITAVPSDSGFTFTAFIADVSERVEAERARERLVAQLRQALRESELRFDTIVGSLSDAVTIRNRDHRLTYANPAALAYLGFASLEELQASSPAEIMAAYRVCSADGKELSMSAIPSVRILGGQAAEPLLIRTVHRESGAERWNWLKAAPLLGDAGEVEATIMFIEDVTAQQRARLHSAFLSRASEVLLSSLDYERTLHNVAELAVPEIADWCAVDLLTEAGTRQSVAVAHSDPSRLRLAERLRAYEPAELDPDQGLGLVFRTGRPLFYPEIPDEMLVNAAIDDRHLELIRGVGMKSAVVVPMRLAGRTLGALTLVTADSGRPLDRLDLELAEQVAARAALAIENARVYSQRAEIAHTLQQSLLPSQLPEIAGYDLAGAYLPAVADGAEVGGDFYDVWPCGSDWLIAIGDVTGKGVSAAALTSLSRHTLRTASAYIQAPSALLAHLNRTLMGQPEFSVCTAACLRLNPATNEVTIASGGHPLPIHVGFGSAYPVGEPGLLLGAFDDATWEEVTVVIQPGATLLLYTDGVTDAIGADRDRFGPDRLHHQLRGVEQGAAAELLSDLMQAIREFQVGAQADDTALLAIRRVAAAESPERLAAGEVRNASSSG